MSGRSVGKNATPIKKTPARVLATKSAFHSPHMYVISRTPTTQSDATKKSRIDEW